jgi:hypothetical protein
VRSTERENNIPVVFISSTVEELRAHREQARDAVLRAGFQPVMKESWVPAVTRRSTSGWAALQTKTGWW